MHMSVIIYGVTLFLTIIFEWCKLKDFFLNQSVGFIGEMWHILDSASVGVA